MVGWSHVARGNEPELDEIKKLLRRLDALGGEQVRAAPAQRIEAWPSVPARPVSTGAPVGAQALVTRDVPAMAPHPSRKPKRSRSAIYAIGATAAVISTVAASILLVWLAAPARPVTGPLPPELVAPNALDDTTVETVEVVRHAAWRDNGAGGIQ